MRRREIITLWVIIVLVSFLGAGIRNTIRGSRAIVIPEIPRPGVSVILGGEGVGIGAVDDKCAMGVISFYTSGGMAVCFAHATSIPIESPTQSVYDGGVFRREFNEIPSARVVTNERTGVVLEGMPLPEEKQSLPLGGTADIRLGEKATVYPAHREPYTVTVKRMAWMIDSKYIGIILIPDNFSGRVRRGISGSPVVQNGTIIAFVSAGTPYGSTIHAILAAEVWNELEPYFVPGN